MGQIAMEQVQPLIGALPNAEAITAGSPADEVPTADGD